jgi:murein DD-endopeptidase MepM/ murein hydrolase activator NlpD
VRATSLPPALPVAPAALPLLVAVLLSPAVPSAAGAERWLRPVPGEVARSFSYTRDAPFAAGAHRGADLAARPGTPVRSACAGTVVHAGPVAGQGAVVSVRCGGRRVSYLPLARVAVRAGAPIRAGTAIGVVSAGHGGLHVGVRREADRFGYQDPLALLPSPGHPRAPSPLALRRPSPPSIPIGRPTRPIARAPRPATPVARAPRPAAPIASIPRALPPLAAAPPSTVLAPPRAPLRSVAPWPVWAGLALLLAGAAGSGALSLRRRRVARRPLGAAAHPRSGRGAPA